LKITFRLDVFLFNPTSSELSNSFRPHKIAKNSPNEITKDGQIVTGNDSEKTISLKNRENFTLILREKPTIGAAWELNLSKGLIILSDHYTSDPAPPGYTGFGGTHSWVIQTTYPGSQQVNGRNKRSWENTTGTEENFTLNVKVTRRTSSDICYRCKTVVLNA